MVDINRNSMESIVCLGTTGSYCSCTARDRKDWTGPVSRGRRTGTFKTRTSRPEEQRFPQSCGRHHPSCTHARTREPPKNRRADWDTPLLHLRTALLHSPCCWLTVCCLCLSMFPTDAIFILWPCTLVYRCVFFIIPCWRYYVVYVCLNEILLLQCTMTIKSSQILRCKIVIPLWCHRYRRLISGATPIPQHCLGRIQTG